MDHLDNLDHLGHLYHLYHLDHLDTSLPIWDVVQDYHSTDPDHSDYTALPPGNMSHVSHTPPGCFLSKLGCSTNQDGMPTPSNTYRLRKAVGERCRQCQPFWHRHYANCGHIEHGKSTQGVCDMHRRIHSSDNSLGERCFERRPFWYQPYSAAEIPTMENRSKGRVIRDTHRPIRQFRGYGLGGQY